MNILNLFSVKKLEEKVKNVWNRFPVTVAIMIAVTILFFVLLHWELVDPLMTKVSKWVASLILTSFFSLSMYLASEWKWFSKTKREGLQIIPLIFWILFYIWFSNTSADFENFVFFFLSLTGIVSLLFFAPYLKNILPLTSKTEGAVKQSIFYTYFYNIAVVILISWIFAWVLFGLGSIWIAAVDTLFNLNIDQKYTYWNWSIISLALIAPLFALTQIPQKESFTQNHFNENMFFSFLIKYVAIPFISLYFLILYAYSVKVLSDFGDWPKWEVTWMVIGFSVFGYLTYIFSYIFEKKNAFISLFRKVFPFIVIPQIFMLFYAIYLRINQYDITVNRYFVVAFWIWLLVTSLHFIFSKKKKLIAIPAGLTLITILISIWPWGVYSLPESRQLARLETNLQKAWIMSTEGFNPLNKKIIPLKKYSDISQELSKNIYGWIDYLCDFDNCEDIKQLFPKIYADILSEDKKEWEKNNKRDLKHYEENKDRLAFLNEEYRLDIENRKYSEPNKWKIVKEITDKIKVKNYFSKNKDNRKIFEYSKDYQQDFFPIDTKGYSKMYRMATFDKWEKRKNYAEYNMEKQEIIIKENDKEIAKFSTQDLTKELIKKFWKWDWDKLNKQDLTFELEGWKYKLYLENITILNPNYKNKKEKDTEWKNRVVQLSHLGGYTNWFLLVK